MLKDQAGARKLQSLLSMLAGGLEESKVGPEFRMLIVDLLKRGLVVRKESRVMRIAITKAGADSARRNGVRVLRREAHPGATILHPVVGSRRQAEAHRREGPSASFFPGRRHPVKEFINEVREVYLSMGFVEIAGNSIQSSFWNFDALFTPQDHPARDLQDTFYIKGGRDEALQRRDDVDRVATAHEDGGGTGSKGWRYRWDIEEARRLVLRTHNTALTVRATMDSGDRETRVFSVGRVYRNETGLQAPRRASSDGGHRHRGGAQPQAPDGVLTRFYGKLGMSGVKLWPSYFPYTGTLDAGHGLLRQGRQVA